MIVNRRATSMTGTVSDLAVRSLAGLVDLDVERTRYRGHARELAAALVALEAVGMCVAAGFAAVSTAGGQSYQRASGVALTLIAVGTAVVFALFARGLARARPWTRTPVVMTQLAIGAWGIYLLKDHRPEWGIPMLLVAACCLAALFTPASLRALNRPPAQP